MGNVDNGEVMPVPGQGIYTQQICVFPQFCYEPKNDFLKSIKKYEEANLKIDKVNKHLQKKDTQMSDKHIQRCSALLITKEM